MEIVNTFKNHFEDGDTNELRGSQALSRRMTVNLTVDLNNYTIPIDVSRTYSDESGYAYFGNDSTFIMVAYYNNFIFYANGTAFVITVRGENRLYKIYNNLDLDLEEDPISIDNILIKGQYHVPQMINCSVDFEYCQIPEALTQIPLA